LFEPWKLRPSLSIDKKFPSPYYHEALNPRAYNTVFEKISAKSRIVENVVISHCSLKSMIGFHINTATA